PGPDSLAPRGRQVQSRREPQTRQACGFEPRETRQPPRRQPAAPRRAPGEPVVPGTVVGCAAANERPSPWYGVSCGAHRECCEANGAAGRFRRFRPATLLEVFGSAAHQSAPCTSVIWSSWAWASSARTSRSRASARLVCVLTLPCDEPIAAAVSETDRSAKNRRTTTSRWRGASS